MKTLGRLQKTETNSDSRNFISVVKKKHARHQVSVFFSNTLVRILMKTLGRLQKTETNSDSEISFRL